MAATDLQLKGIEEGIGQTDRQWVEKVRARASQLVMPTRALGRLHEISEKLCEIFKRPWRLQLIERRFWYWPQNTVCLMKA